MKLRDLIRGVPVRATEGNLDVEITAVVADSRLAVRGSLFVAIPGLQHDGAKFIDSALEKGAIAVASERPSAPLPAASQFCIRPWSSTNVRTPYSPA